MAVVYDRWERLVESVLLREELRLSALRTPSDLSSSSAVTSRTPSDISPSSFIMASPLPSRLIAFDQIRKATADFANKLGHLYKGEHEDGVPVVLKETDPGDCGLELKLFSNSRHRRRVPLVGYYVGYRSEKYLLYKHMQNGDLSMYLHKPEFSREREIDSMFLYKPKFSRERETDWITRMKIATGVAEGLSCLHHDYVPSIVHGDIRARNILLDINFDVRLGWLANTRQHKSKRTLTPADDVHSYGKVLLELFGGKLQGYDRLMAELGAGDKKRMYGMYRDIFEYGMYRDIFDELIDDQLQLAEEWKVAIVVEACLETKPLRPLMKDILGVLRYPSAEIMTRPPYMTTVHPNYFMREINEFPVRVKQLLYPSTRRSG